MSGGEVSIHDSLKSPYTWRYGLLSALAGKPAPSNDPDRFVPPTFIRSDDEKQQTLTRLPPLLGLKGHELVVAIQESLSEMLRNVYEHAHATRGDWGFGACVCASYFPGAGRVTVAIVDTGKGIPVNIRRKYGAQYSDAQAIDAALQWSVSGATGDTPFGGTNGAAENAGIGLHQVRTVATRSGGMMAVAAGDGWAESRRFEEIRIATMASSWNGTAVTLTINPARAAEAWEQRNRIQARLDDPKKELVTWGACPETGLAIEIKPTVGSMIEDKDVANRLRKELVIPALKSGQPVGLDLRGASVMTHTFGHALLYEAFRLARDSSRALIFVHARDRQIRDIVRMVARYAHEDAAAGNEPDPAADLQDS